VDASTQSVLCSLRNVFQFIDTTAESICRSVLFMGSQKVYEAFYNILLSLYSRHGSESTLNQLITLSEFCIVG